MHSTNQVSGYLHYQVKMFHVPKYQVTLEISLGFEWIFVLMFVGFSTDTKRILFRDYLIVSKA